MQLKKISAVRCLALAAVAAGGVCSAQAQLPGNIEQLHEYLGV